MTSDPTYCYDNGVLKNLLGIRNNEKLYSFEREESSVRIAELGRQPIEGSFDLEHLQKIHEYIFQNIYPWAGELRTVDIAKSEMFCKVLFLQSYSEEVFRGLKSVDYYKSLSRESVAIELSHFFGDLNALHPFREGNGRTQREFIREFLLKIGYEIDFTGVSEQEMIDASIASFLCDYSLMEEMFKRQI